MKHIRNASRRYLIYVAIVLVAIALGAAWQLSKHSERQPTRAQVITYSTDRPDENKPDKSYEWKGGSNDPKKIIIPTLGIDNYLQNVGVDQSKQVATPTNIYLAGWFADSVRPGEKGLSIIDGHLNGHRKDGIFVSLEKITKGTTYSIEFGDGSTKQFEVVDIKTAELEDAAGVLFSQDPNIRNQLNLVTCGGTFDRQARLYNKRVIVVSELASAQQ
jgi:sortase (surface protein transpeptidase)